MPTPLLAPASCSQVFILDSVVNYTPTDAKDAEVVVERVLPRLQHANAAVVLSAIKVIIKNMQVGGAGGRGWCFARVWKAGNAGSLGSNVQHRVPHAHLPSTSPSSNQPCTPSSAAPFPATHPCPALP